MDSRNVDPSDLSRRGAVRAQAWASFRFLGFGSGCGADFATEYFSVELGSSPCCRAGLKHSPASCPASLECAAFYFDDGFVAGTEEGFSWYTTRLEAETMATGLAAIVAKTTILPSAGPALIIDPSACAGCGSNVSRNVEVLGAAVGELGVCSALVHKQRRNTGLMLRNIELRDLRGGHLFLRSCASFGKLVYSVRTSHPLFAITAELGSFGWEELGGVLVPLLGGAMAASKERDASESPQVPYQAWILAGVPWVSHVVHRHLATKTLRCMRQAHACSTICASTRLSAGRKLEAMILVSSVAS